MTTKRCRSTTKCSGFPMENFIKLFPNPSFAKVLGMFLIHPEEEYYQTYISEKTGTALIQVQRALKRLEESGLVKKHKSGNRNYYKANRTHPAFEDIKKAFLKTVLFGDLLKRALKPISGKISYGFIYGSIARGDESEKSDIDLFLVGNLGLREIASILNTVGGDVGREINPTVYSEKELKKKLKEENPFLKEVFQRPKIWLIGGENDFKKMV